MDRKKDMIITGGFNVYPSDLEAELRQASRGGRVAVVGVPSRRMGRDAGGVRRAACRPRRSSRNDPRWLNDRVGKTQRLTDLRFIDELPRSAIGKVLKRELRDAYRP